MRATVLIFFCLSCIGCTSDASITQSGRWKVVNFWAIWCKPCREEIPELRRLDEREDVSVLGVNFDGKQGNDLATDVASLGITFQNIEDPSEVLGVPRPTVLPTTLVITPSGELVATLIGPQTIESLEAVIRQSGPPR